MAKTKKPPTFQTQAEQNIMEEALGIARGIQVPGQTKDQTRQIASGIAKGIAQYKKQEKAKIRERDKVKRKAKVSNNTSATKQTCSANPSSKAGFPARRSAKTALVIGASIFFTVAALHLLRFILQTSIIIGTQAIPIDWSIPVAVITFCLAVWFAVLARSGH